jgi:aldehyde dehydrogenase (NAD+)
MPRDRSRLVELGLFVDGVLAPARATFPVHAPEDSGLVGHAARADAADVDRAVDGARRAFPAWANLPPGDRERILARAADAVEREGPARLLDLIIDESGSTITKARGEIAYAAQILRAAAGEVRRISGETFPNDRPTRISMVLREPIGVVAVISPFNSPIALFTKMVAFPLAAGNTVVAKPSEETPLSAVELARILAGAGLPPGVLQVLTGFGVDAGQALVEHVDVAGIAFTGSTATGARIAASASSRMKRVQLELGGKNPLVILADADVEESAAIACEGAFAHAGQICMASARIIVERAIGPAFVEAFAERAKRLVLGDLRDEATAYGPLVNRAALEKVERHVGVAVATGAALVTGGRREAGLVYRPTILAHVSRACEAWREETFGPVAAVVFADGLEHAIELANDSDYGLSAAVLGRDVQRALTCARRIRAGSVHVGMHSFQSNALAPIGGYGMSGIGRSGGRWTIEEFTEPKWVSIELGTAPFAGAPEIP